MVACRSCAQVALVLSSAVRGRVNDAQVLDRALPRLSRWWRLSLGWGERRAQLVVWLEDRAGRVEGCGV